MPGSIWQPCRVVSSCRKWPACSTMSTSLPGGNTFSVQYVNSDVMHPSSRPCRYKLGRIGGCIHSWFSSAYRAGGRVIADGGPVGSQRRPPALGCPDRGVDVAQILVGAAIARRPPPPQQRQYPRCGTLGQPRQLEVHDVPTTQQLTRQLPGQPGAVGHPAGGTERRRGRQRHDHRFDEWAVRHCGQAGGGKRTPVVTDHHVVLGAARSPSAPAVRRPSARRRGSCRRPESTTAHTRA